MEIIFGLPSTEMYCLRIWLGFEYELKIICFLNEVIHLPSFCINNLLPCISSKFTVNVVYVIKPQTILARRSIHLCLSSARNLILKNFTTYWKQQKAMQKKDRVLKLTFPGTSLASWVSIKILWKVSTLIGLNFYLLRYRGLMEKLSGKSLFLPHVLALSIEKAKFGDQLWFKGKNYMLNFVFN